MIWRFALVENLVGQAEIIATCGLLASSPALPRAKIIPTKVPGKMDFTDHELRENFRRWESSSASSSDVFPVDDSAERAVTKAPTTHTFGWRSGSVTELHRRILLEDRALLASSPRHTGNPAAKANSVSALAASAGLDEFVFAYLGVHDPYYARTFFPAFGIFVRKTAEEFPYCNATRRDLASPEVDSALPLRLQFLLPEDARKLTMLQLRYDSRHKGDFNHYWGDPRLWVGNYAKFHWTWISEFHFRDHVSIDEFHAILWPRETMVSPFTLGRKFSPPTHDQIEFARENPECKVVSYDSYSSKPVTTLITASVAATTHYVNTGHFPDSVP